MYPQTIGSGYAGLFVGAGVSGSGVSWGSVVYYGGFNMANNYIAQYLPGKTPNALVIKGAALAGFSDVIKTLVDNNLGNAAFFKYVPNDIKDAMLEPVAGETNE